MVRAATLIARASNATALTRRAQRRLARRHAAVLRASDGRRMGRWFGAPVLVLETTGRRSGERRSTPLIYLEDEAGLVVIAANGGADRVPSWWLNLRAAGRAAVRVGGERRDVMPREAHGSERDRLWRAFAAMYPSLDDYPAMTDRRLPVVVLEPPGDS